MPKMKTKRGAAKRFKVSGSGRIRRGAAGKQHRMMRGDKNPSRRRSLRKNKMVRKCDFENIRFLIPYKFSGA